MGAPTKYICFLMFLMILRIAGVFGAGECGKSSIDNEVMKLAPCALAAHDEKAEVSDKCCTVVKDIDVSCLCAIMLSNIAKSSGIKPEVAITIPKRCNIANRPVGYKCGGVLMFHYNLQF
ncbi:hypothetical protein RGQ29_029121 [Quercus rubra]|uniref:Bifunctional inhibitor/plant lipid transfer protein/seed storage helical domain-containing protein n=1 Tax=Quercus rubra TaxID=3512 RepID=A0AAN7ETR3_QUERU|nr:hypothetical protein RGQ29_029121 [Quercus rubra]